MIFKSLSTFLLLIALFTSAIAQTTQERAKKRIIDSLKMEALSGYAMRYPQLRQGSFATDFIGSSNVKAELNGKELFEGKTTVTRIRSVFSVPIAQWGKNAITGTVSYQQQHFETTNIKSFDPQFSSNDRSLTKSTVGFTASFSRADSIFGKQVIYSGSISGITDEASSIKRVNYLGTASVPLKRTPYSSLTVGLVVILDPSAVAPFIPIVSYWRKYKKSDLELFVDIPSRIALRKQLSKRSWTSIGSELGGSLSFFELNQPSFPQNNIYSNIEIRTGATFEYLLTKKIIFGINGGLFTTASNRMFDRNNKPTDYFYKSTNGSSPYISFSISLLPFFTHL